MCEDVYVGAKAVLAGYTIHYNAEACVIHSHNYSLLEEFRRYFDIGVFYHQEKWIVESFSKAEKEGIKYVKAEIRHLINSGSKRLIPEMLLRTSLKYAGYLMGKHEKSIPMRLKRVLSMHHYYWK
jgi:rhamnosyltransferase